MRKNFVLTIKAEDRPGLLHRVIGVVEKRLVKIISLSSAPTDIHGIVLITIEVLGEENILAQLAFKLENIIELFSLEVSCYNRSVCLRAAYFKLEKAFLESPQAIAMYKYDTIIVKFYPETFLLAKCGTNETILKLYNDLDGPYLLGFSQTGLIMDSKLIGEDQSLVLNRLAA